MIETSLSELLSIYVAVFLAAIFCAWICYAWRRRRRENAWLRHRLRCMICALEFEDRTTTVLPRCPRCGSLNERLKLRII